MQLKLSKIDKFSRANASALLGYSTTQKGYILFNLRDKTFLVSRDIVFYENEFPFEGGSWQNLLYPYTLSNVPPYLDESEDETLTHDDTSVDFNDNSEISPDSATRGVIINIDPPSTMPQPDMPDLGFAQKVRGVHVAPRRSARIIAPPRRIIILAPELLNQFLIIWQTMFLTSIFLLHIMHT